MSAPSALLDVPCLLGAVAATPSGYLENHTVTKSFSQTVTLDESGTGTSGPYTLDVAGTAHAHDTATGSGAGITSSSGAMTSDIAYHLVIHGHQTPDGTTVDDASFSEVGSGTASYVIVSVSPAGDVTTNDGSMVENWSLSWSGTVSNGVLTYASFNYSGYWQQTTHLHIDYAGGGGGSGAPPGGSQGLGGGSYDQLTIKGQSLTESGAGAQASYNLSSWQQT